MDELRHLGLEALWKASPLAVVSLAVISVSDDRMDGLSEENSPEAPSVSPLLNDPLANDPQEAILSLISFDSVEALEKASPLAAVFTSNHSMDELHEENSPVAPSAPPLFDEEAPPSPLTDLSMDELQEASSPGALSPLTDLSMDDLQEASSPLGSSVPPLLSIAEGKVDIPQAKKTAHPSNPWASCNR
ncbi:hypothetical protein B0H10DRAFT_2239555 [Mycena sp. CBHHK59/15]|nr:hypothetical protein B0H10DRAFT_2239555 [Mycena sp. CBHHK59/15]